MEPDADELFARGAVKAGALSEEKSQELLRSRAGGLSLPERCREENLLTPKQIRAILKEAYDSLREEDARLGARAVEEGLVDDESVQLARDEQERAFRGEKALPPRLTQILVSMEALTEEQVRALSALPPPAPPESPGRLVRESGPGATDDYALGGKALIGRFATHEVPLPDPGVSRRHACIEFYEKARQHVLTDLGSPNGTFVNGERVEKPRPLKSGDKIRVGETVLRYEAGKGVQADYIPSGDTRVLPRAEAATPPPEPKPEAKAGPAEALPLISPPEPEAKKPEAPKEVSPTDETPKGGTPKIEPDLEEERTLMTPMGRARAIGKKIEQLSLHRQRKFAAIACAAGMFCTFLPWVHLPFVGAMLGARGDGWITFILFGAALAILLWKDRDRALPKKMQIAVIVPAALAALVGIIKIIQIKGATEGNPLADALVSVGVGLYFAILAGLAVPGLVYFFRAPAEIAPEPAAPAPKGVAAVRAFVMGWGASLKTSVRDLKKGLRLKDEIRRLAEVRDHALLKLGEAAMKADVKCTEAETAKVQEEKLEAAKKRSPKVEAALKMAEDKRALAFRKLGRHAVEQSLKLEGQDGGMAEVRRLDPEITALEKDVVAVPALILRQKHLLVTAGAGLVLLVMLVSTLTAGGPGPLPRAQAFPLADRARAFNSIKPWDDFTPEERALLEAPIAAAEWEQPLRAAIGVPWATATLKEAIQALGASVSALRAAAPRTEESKAAYEAAARALTAKFEVYLQRLSYERLKHYGDASRAMGQADTAGTLVHLEKFMRFHPDPSSLDAGSLDPTVSSLCIEAMKRAPEEIEAAAKALLKGLRGHGRPVDANQAELMYDAEDVGKFGQARELTPGKWYSYRGEYAGRAAKYHLLRREKMDFVAFTTMDNLSNVPDGTKMEVVGAYRSMEEFQTVLGLKVRAPQLDDSLIFRRK